MDTKSLKAFIQVYRYQNLTQAAKVLYVSPQGLSKTIQKMEAELGVALFVRRPTGMFPTPEADSLYRRADTIIRELDAVTDGSVFTETQEIILGMTSGLLRMMSIDFFTDFKNTHPEISLHVVENTDRALLRALADGEMNLAIVSGPIEGILYDAVLFTCVKACVLVNVNSPLANLDKISRGDLEQVPIVISNHDFSVFNPRWNFILNNINMKHAAIETLDMNVNAMAAEKTEWAALCVDHPAFLPDSPHIKAIPYAEGNGIWDTFLVKKRYQNLSEAENTVFTFMLSWLRSHHPELIQPRE